MKIFFSKISENLFFLLLLVSRPRLNKIPNNNREKYKIELPTCKTLYLSGPNLTYSIFLLKIYYVDIFLKVLYYLLDYNLPTKAKT